MRDCLTESKAIQEEIIEHRRYLHEHAELGFDLPETKKYVKETLTAYGYAPEEKGGGIVCEAGSGDPVFLLRADMDALPMKEESGLPFASGTCAMHSCGHDAHTAMLLGAAKLLKEREGELKGTVRFMFQPAEELLAGARAMIEAGVLEGVSAAMGLHMAFGVQKEYYAAPGRLIVPGVMCSGDEFEIRILGKGTHGSTPETGISPITAGANVVLAMEELCEKYRVNGRRAVISAGTFHSGDKANIIPEAGMITGTVRTTDPAVRKAFKAEFEETVREAAAKTGATAVVEYVLGTDANVSDPALTEEIFGWCEGIFPEIERIESMGASEDFAYSSSRVPSFFAFLGAGGPEEGYEYPMHNPGARFDESVLPLGTAAFTACAVKWLRDHQE